MDGLAFRRTQAAGLDDFTDLIHAQFHHVVRIVCQRKQMGCDLIHPLIGTLRRKQNRNQQRIDIAVVERNRGLRKVSLQLLLYKPGSLFLRHRAKVEFGLAKYTYCNSIHGAQKIV